MKRFKIYSCLISFALAFTACSNLDESAYTINSTTDATTIYSETFESGLGEFTQYSDSGAQSWSYNSSGYAIMTGYVSSTNNANVDWLISPVIDLSAVSAAHLSFDHAPRYFADISSEATVWVSTDYETTKDPKNYTWTKLKVNPFTDPGSWTFSSSGQISLTAYAGKKIRIAFKYISSATKAGTWEVQNFVVTKGEATSDASIVYSNSFGSSKGDFTAISVTGAQVWAYSSAYTSMVMSGYATTNNANEDWLVSPEIDLTNISNSYVTFDQAGKFFGTPANEATLMISENYTDSAHFASSTWTKLNILNYFTNTSYTFVNSGNIDLSSYAGKKVRLALKYTSTTSTAGTWEVRNFNVYSGLAYGTQTNPFPTTIAINSQSGGSAWIQGYIVGYTWPFLSQYNYFMSADTCTQVQNILVTDSIGQRYSSKCIAVQLTRGGIRNGLNLRDNKSLIGTKVKLYGTLSTYMGIAGLINPQKYVLENGNAGTGGTTTLYSETFGSSLGSFTTNNVAGASQYWKFSSGYGAAMSGYANSTNNVNEDWLISPEIDMTKITSAAMSFDHTINKGLVANMKTEQTLYVTSDNGTTWTKVAIPTYPTGSSWVFVNSGEISLDAFAGKKIKIAFKYISTSQSAATWEVKNVLIYY